MRLVLRKYYLLLVCTIFLFSANNSLQAQNVLDQAGLTSATPAAAAYGTRKLSSAYTGPVMRIRRALDNAEADLAFDASGILSSSSTATFVSGGTGTLSLNSFAAATDAFVSIWYDQSGNGRHATQTLTANQPMIVSAGTVINNPNLSNKPTITFNGSNSFLNLPMSSSLVNAAGTIAAVQVQPSLQSGFNAVVAWSSTSGGTQGPGFGPLNALGAFGLYTTWGPQNLNMGPVATNQKYIINASWSGNGNVIVESKNGNQLTGSFGAAFNFVGNAWIGRDNGGYYNGSMAELIVSTTTISSSNRTAMEQSQGSFYGVSLTSAGALNFDGVNDYVNVGNVLGTSYTKEAWVNIGNTTATDNFISGGASSQHAFWAPSAYANRLSAGHNEIWNQVQDPTPLNVGQWYHVAVTYDAPTTTMKLYKNGVLVSTNTAVPAYIGGGNLVLLGAYDANLNLLNGSMDEVRIWSRALCQGEILNNMNGVLSGTQTGLSAYYKFNQGWVGLSNTGINTLIDESGNGKNGSLVGFSLTGNTSNWVAGTVTGTSAVFTNTPSPIVGANSVCIGATTTLTNANSGIWSSSNTAVATVSATGLVTGVSAGSAVISFNNLCGAVSSKLITVSAIPTISIANPTPNVNLGNAATLTATSNLGKALQFNGANYVDMGTGVALNGTFTQEAWIYSTLSADNNYHGFLGNTSNSGLSYTRTPCMYVYNGNTLHGGFGDGTAFYYYITQPGVIAPNTWYHVAQTFDGVSLKCYVNGVQVPLASVVNNPAGKIPVAAPVKTLGKLDNSFSGNIDEVRLWNQARTQAQIQADMNKGVPVNSTGLVGYWKLDEGTGTSTYDIKQETVGTLQGSPIWVASTAPIGGAFSWTPATGLNSSNTSTVIATPTATTTYTATATDGTSGCAVSGTTTVTVFNQPATALALDGVDDYVKVADNASLDFGANDFTVETWTLKQANSSGFRNSGIVGKWNTGATPGSNEWILNNTSNGSDNLPAFLIENGPTFYRVAGTVPMNLNQWYHLAAVRKGTLLSLYVNGVLASAITIPANLVLNNVGRDLLIGGYIVNGSGIPSLFSSAKIDELRIWNRALCLDEINNNRNGELTGTQNGLVAYYKFNQGFIGGNNVGITTLADASGNNNNGTLFNFATAATGNWVAGTITGNSPTFVPATAPITGTASACIGATSVLANSNQGVWSSNNTSVATVNAAGVVTAIAAGTSTITFTNTCGGISTITFTVNPKPTASISTASPLTVCLGAAVLLDASTNASPATYQWFKNGTPIPTATNASFNAIASGSYTVVVANANGCVSNTSNAMLVTIEDIIKPYFSSGGTVTSATNAQGQVLATSALGAVVTYNAPVGADNCTVVSNVLTAGLASGSVFPIGTTTVTYTVTDGAGLTETSSFDVVVSGLAPAIIAPANITVNNDEGQCGAVVNFAATGSIGIPAATITYTEDGQPVVSGASFAIGVHTITATATNAVGSSSVNFTITVVNTDHPTITAQGPTVFCEDGSVTLTASEGSSYYWNTGETTQSITVYSAGNYSASVTNAFGCPTNTNTITTTTIALPTAPEITGAEQVCANSNTALTANIAGGVWSSENENIATVDAQGHVTGVSEGSVQIMYSITNESGCISIGYFTIYVKPLPLTGVITGITDICLGGTSRLDVSNPNGRNDDRSVWTTSNASVVTVVEYPSGIDINGIGLGTATITKTLNLNGCSAVIATAVVTVTNPAIPVITASGATTFCAGESVVLTASEGSSYLWSNGATTQSITVTSAGEYSVTVTNQLGCSATSLATVVTVNTAPVFTTTTENKTAFIIPNQCNALVNYLVEATGVNTPTLTYQFTGATTGTGVGTGSGKSFNVGITNITITAANQCGSSTLSFTVTVVDNQLPEIVAPDNISAVATSAAGAMVTYVAPVGTDNCTASTVRTAGLASGSVFPIGVTTVTYTVTDASGNKASASFTVTVVGVAPVIVAPENITQNNDAGQCGASVSFAATETTAIPASAFTYSENGQAVRSGQLFSVGSHTITATATNAVGSSSASFTVTVIDKQSPTVLAKNITVGLSAVGGTVSITAADVNNGSSDACGIASMTVVPSSFSCANVGANTVTLTVTDVNGNVSSTTAIVTVVDDKGPVPTAVLPVISGQCYATALTLKRGEKAELEDGRLELDHYYLVAPTAMDNCSGLIKGTTTDPLTYYNQGTYIIHWKFVDARGNVTIQEQTVLVKDTEAPRPKYASLPTITGQCSVSLVNTNSYDDDGDHEGREGDDHEGDEDENHYDEHQRGAPWAKDNCSGWVRGTTTDPLTYTVQGTYIIHWSFNDGHGNISTQTQTVIVKDITKPKIKAPNDKTVTCGSNLLPAVTGMATATDNCSVPVISYTDVNNGNQIVRTWRATDAAGNISTDVQVIKLTTAFSGTVVSVPTSTVYTGGEVNNLYLGYGAQGTALTVTGLPSSGAPYTYSWSGVATNRLSATNTGAPVFSPIAGGVYTFTVTMTNKNGCSNTASISICVTDIRVPGSNGALVYVCHKGTGKTGGTQTLQVPIAQVASHIQTNTCGGKNDRLGSCDQNPCNSGNSSSAIDPKQLEEPITVQLDGKSAAAPVAVEELKVVVMPNPTTTYFTIRLASKDKAPVNLRVMDGSGRVIDAKQQMEPNSSFQMGHGYSSGTYYAEFIQGNKRKVIQLIKGRG